MSTNGVEIRRDFNNTLTHEEFEARLNTLLARLSGALDNSTEVVSV